MGKVKLLDKHTAELIAAGEVVERPSSVVKELVENCIDAHATVITVEIRHGGAAYIRVTDNGEGMAPDDVPTAFLRHATSKIRTGEDLDCIASLGASDIYKEEFIGKLLYRVRPEQLRRCDVYFGNGITDTGEPDDLDVDSPNSRADVELGMQMQRDSLQKELDSSPAYVFEDDGSVRVETEAEWRERIRRRKRAERRARKKA